MPYKCKECGNTKVKYLGRIKGVKVETCPYEEEIAEGDEEKTEKNLFICMNPECGNIGYISDFEIIKD